MNVPYTQNDNCYVLTNFAASNNPIFMDEEEVENFKNRLSKHLDKLVHILAYSFHADHYQILVSLKNREVFEEFYKNKMGDPDLPEIEIPLSTYILSQEMANIQSGYAKWFNYRHVRYGSVFGRRYTKILVETEEELKEWVEKLNDNKVLWSFEELWSYTKNFIERIEWIKKITISSSLEYNCEKIIKSTISNFIRISDFLSMRGQYVPKPPYWK